MAFASATAPSIANLLSPSDYAAPGSTAVVVNPAFVRQYFRGENPLGRPFEKKGDEVYEPMLGVNGTLEVRTAGDPLAIVPTIRRAIQEVNSRTACL